MTIIAGGYDKKRNIIFGADRQSTSGSVAILLSEPKIFKRDEILMGVCGWTLLRKVLMFDFKIPDHETNLTDEEYINTVFITKLRKCLKKHNVSTVKDEREDTKSCILMAYRKKIYKIDCDFCVTKFDKGYYAVGSGQDFALGALDTYKEIKKEINEEAITLAVKSATKNDIYCSGKIDIIKE